MEQTYWFIRFSVFFTLDPDEGLNEIRGNAVFTLKSKSFLPGSIISDLQNFYKSELAKKRRVMKEIEVYIDSVLEVDQDGATDFSMIGLLTRESVLNRTIVSRHFFQKTKIVFAPSH
ncbi:MAG: hypothetical protein A3A96_04105 [Candidatus Zambryskibacteria bacterium RIFCSPLOWO2_01_FULL_39_39]|uniref:Uncharacterized protein n=1 Tax=Candidatus Zambryskibacteria bacterium RIFCSPLOWO2_01_FULL_39_39 TaxID=1802758 RepID=A0A1G2TX37_9BACT|nr:MAG: hypothetical protein A2644_03730 [Candidatus Zambryskibacteria bacterium RIFCSPHIGHO2_01_FULL_39_63]OHA95288.1 MAG: hypothetical protein A3B88_02270 [Candidatus Zambryskibacteria bacterium RIFCSPHIGHO2_02_FULL_39_19]OHA98866.1 MAG: hypothetical protein A3F20_02365 [Candidatus Zambryskibacteria bacterium RIFCSPHIGHO2_12_FULL_39_21]OHB01719.1 MAG: hypothetical protein A3A96_04105 [Candidatus Zambryskibacteria bacterium RIFCSPLOWO2_01_FULL_39_39]